MQYLKKRLVLFALTLAHISLSAQSPANRFHFVNTDSSDASWFVRETAQCAQETSAFSDILSMTSDSAPLDVRIGAPVSDVLFGMAFEPKSSKPLLRIDRTEFRALPTVAQVRSWTADSSWGVTRCEILGHELAEAIQYRQLWDLRSQMSGSGSDDALTLLRRQAHAFALMREEDIAASQRTRLDPSGWPYMRTGFCNLPQPAELLIVIGANTEILLLRGDSIGRVYYAPGRNLCGN